MMIKQEARNEIRKVCEGEGMFDPFVIPLCCSSNVIIVDKKRKKNIVNLDYVCLSFKFEVYFFGFLKVCVNVCAI